MTGKNTVLKKRIRCIAVVGAGIAGLSCATELQQAGATVRIFEKSGGAAGRMSTRRGEDWQCDHGAQYFTARDPGFLATEDAIWRLVEEAPERLGMAAAHSA